MGIRYQISDSELANVKVGSSPSSKAGSNRSSKKSNRFGRLTLLIGILIVWTIVFNSLSPHVNWWWNSVTAKNATVTAISYDSEGPCAVVLGEIVHEGEIVKGFNIVKIHDDRVDFIKNGNHVTERVTSKPSLFGITL